MISKSIHKGATCAFRMLALAMPLAAMAGDSELKSLKRSLENLREKGKISAKLVNLTNTKTLIDVDSEAPLNPASAIKVFTGYTALNRLGVNFSFQTSVHGGVEGLCFRGGGDPSLVMEDAFLIAHQLKRKGFDKVSGKMTIDSSVFDSELIPEDRTDQDSERAYNSPISGLNFNYNTITVFVTPTKKGEPARVSLDWPFSFVNIHSKVTTGGQTGISWNKTTEKLDEKVFLGGKIGSDSPEWKKPFRLSFPPRGFGLAMAKMLKDVGVTLTSDVVISEGTCVGDPIWVHQSRPLSAVIALMNKFSNNFIADALVKMMGHEATGKPGTTADGIQVMKDQLIKMGITPEEKGRNLVSGSGLTRANSFSASDFIRFLKFVHQEKTHLPELFSSLPIAGVDGTLKRKFNKSAVYEKLRGKTGSLNSVQSLVGVYPNSEGEWIAIAILVNGPGSIPESELAKFLGSL